MKRQRKILVNLGVFLLLVVFGITDYARSAEEVEYIESIGQAGSAQDAEEIYTNFIASFNDTTVSLVGYVESNNSIFVLSSKIINDADYRLDPDNVRSYNATILVTKIYNKQIIAQIEIAQLYGGSKNDNSYHSIKRGAIDIVDDNIIVFFSEKSSQKNRYGQNGYIYSINPINLEYSIKNLFSNANWGWFPYFDSNGNLWHFSFNGYFMYKNTSKQKYTRPSVAAVNGQNKKFLAAGESRNIVQELSWNNLSETLLESLKAKITRQHRQ
jgi:hypothetical protein